MKITQLTLVVCLAALTIAPSFALQGDKMDQNSTAKSMKMMAMTSTSFKGIEVNGGTVSVGMDMGKKTLKLSPDFKVPNSPAPHWQIVDGKGNVYLLQQLRIKDDKMNLQIQIPSYIKSIAKVQIWCSFAEVNLGEATFKTPLEVR